MNPHQSAVHLTYFYAAAPFDGIRCFTAIKASWLVEWEALPSVATNLAATWRNLERQHESCSLHSEVLAALPQSRPIVINWWDSVQCIALIGDHSPVLMLCRAATTTRP